MNLTVATIFIVVAIIAIYDVWVIMARGKYESISAHLIRIFRAYPLVTLILGIVLGHLTWSMSDFDWRDRVDIAEKCKTYMEEK